MDFRIPGSDVLGVNEASVLAVLARVDHGPTGRQIARLAGFESPASAQRALHRLVSIGILDALSVGNALVYTINREHVLWYGLEQLLQARRTFFRRLREEAESALPPGATLFLFGSVARHEAGPESDIDLGIIFEDETDGTVREATVDLFMALSERMSGNEAQVFAVDERDLARMQAESDPVVDSWRQDAIDISGWPLRTRMEALRS